MCTDIPWRDLTSYFGAWSAIWRRFNLWTKKDILNELFRLLSRAAIKSSLSRTIFHLARSTRPRYLR
ncbi:MULTISPECIES: transposase [Pseudoalteromonas]